MEDDPQDLGGEENHEHDNKALIIKNTQKPGAEEPSDAESISNTPEPVLLIIMEQTPLFRNKGQYRYG